MGLDTPGVESMAASEGDSDTLSAPTAECTLCVMCMSSPSAVIRGEDEMREEGVALAGDRLLLAG